MISQKNTSVFTSSLDVSPDGILYGVGFFDFGYILYTVNPFDGAINFIGKTSPGLTQITFAPDGTLYGINYGSTLYKINKETAQTTQVATLSSLSNSYSPLSIDFAPDGTLYAVKREIQYLINPDTFKLEIKDTTELLTLDKTTGERLNKIADLDSSPADDMDYAPDGFIYYIHTYDGKTKSQLIQVDPKNGSSKIIKDRVEGAGIASLPVVSSITPITDPGGNTLETAHLLALNPFDTTTHTIQGYVGNINEIDPIDLYRIELSRITNIEISLTDLVGDADLTLLDEKGSIEWGFRNFSNQLINNEERYAAVLSKGTYYIHRTYALYKLTIMCMNDIWSFQALRMKSR